MEYDNVVEFRRHFKYKMADKPTHLSSARLTELMNAMLGELIETAEAGGLYFDPLECGFIEDKSDEASQDLGEIVDGLVDLTYFAIGAAATMGLSWHKHWAEVHAANMRKELGPDGDVVKPEDWVGPDHNAILDEDGYELFGPELDDPGRKR